MEIDADEFARLFKAREVLDIALAIEEKYEIVVANFLDFETELLRLAAVHAVRTSLEYRDIFEKRTSLNIRLVNLLTAARLYLDQLPQHIAAAGLDGVDARAEIRIKCSQEYDAHFGYRFMEALRNHVQHKGIPVHLYTDASRRVEIGCEWFLEYSVEIAAQHQFLESDRDFKKTVLAEMQEDVDLKSAARRYIECISSINQCARELMSTSTTQSRKVVEAMRNRYIQASNEEIEYLVATASDGDEISTKVLLHLDWDDVRVVLQARNRNLINLSKRYATGRIRDR